MAQHLPAPRPADKPRTAWVPNGWPFRLRALLMGWHIRTKPTGSGLADPVVPAATRTETLFEFAQSVTGTWLFFPVTASELAMPRN